MEKMSGKTKSLVFRADGNSKIGLGHVYRLMAFADLADPKYNKVFVINSETPPSVFREGDTFIQIPVMSADEEVRWFLKNYQVNQTLWIIDGYQFTHDYQKALHENGVRFVYVGDFVSI